LHVSLAEVLAEIMEHFLTEANYLTCIVDE